MGDGPTATPSIGLVAESGVDTPAGWTRLAAPVTAGEYARELYAALRAADAQGLEVVVAVLPDPEADRWPWQSATAWPVPPTGARADRRGRGVRSLPRPDPTRGQSVPGARRAEVW